MGKFAVAIGPDLTPDVDPAFAEGKILAEVGSVFGDRAFKQSETVIAFRCGVDGMIALVPELRIARAHLLDRASARHKKAGAGVANFDETGAFSNCARIVDLKNIFQRRRSRIGRALLIVEATLSQSICLIG